MHGSVFFCSKPMPIQAKTAEELIHHFLYLLIFNTKLMPCIWLWFSLLSDLISILGIVLWFLTILWLGCTNVNGTHKSAQKSILKILIYLLLCHYAYLNYLEVLAYLWNCCLNVVILLLNFLHIILDDITYCSSPKYSYTIIQ